MRTTSGALLGTSPASLSLPVLIRRWLIIAIATSLFGVSLSAVAGSFDAGQTSDPQVLSSEGAAAKELSPGATPIESPISTAPTDRVGETSAGTVDAAETNATAAPATTAAPTTSTAAPEATEPETAPEAVVPETDSSLPTETSSAPTTTTPTPTTTAAPTSTAAPTTTSPEAAPSPTTTVPQTTTTAAPVTTTATAPPASGSGAVDTAFASDLVAKANHARASEGIAPLSVSGSLTTYATAWASHLADTHSLSHSDIGSLLGAWSTVGENVAAGHPSAQAMHDAWMASSGHRANILDPSFTHIGVGVVIDDNGTPRGVEVFGG